MLLQYNFQNSRAGQAKVNVIYTRSQTLSKITIINGTRFRINYPYNFTKSLTSNVLVVQKIKFGNNQKNSNPMASTNSNVISTENPNTNKNDRGLNVRKVLVSSLSKERNKNHFQNFLKKKVVDSENSPINNNENLKNKLIINNLHVQDDFDNSKRNLNSKASEIVHENENRNINNLVSPIMNMPIQITKSKVLPSIHHKNSNSNSTSTVKNLNNHAGHSNTNTNNLTSSNEKLYRNFNNIPNNLSSPANRVKLSLLKRIKNNSNNLSNRNSVNGISVNLNASGKNYELNTNNLVSEKKEENFISNLEVDNNNSISSPSNENNKAYLKSEASPNHKRIVDKTSVNNQQINNNSNKPYLVFFINSNILYFLII